jgi:hypothetical protein
MPKERVNELLDELCSLSEKVSDSHHEEIEDLLQKYAVLKHKKQNLNQWMEQAGSTINQIKKSHLELIEELKPIQRIYLSNDSFAFFDIDKPGKEPINVAFIEDKSYNLYYGQPHNYLVDKRETQYFNTTNYEGNLYTVAVTGPCIVFCAYTNKSSGVYHAQDTRTKFLQENLCKLINSVKSTPAEEVIIKAAGASSWIREDELEEIKKEIKRILTEQGVEVKQNNLVLTYKKDNLTSRITKFYPKTKELTTHLSGSKNKKII